MGREIKRVPVDFNWDRNKVWEGFLNPHYKGHCEDCKKCKGSGNSEFYQFLHDRWYGLIDGFVPMNPFPPEHPRIAQLAARNYPSSEGMQQQERARLAALFNSAWSHHLIQDDVDVLWEDGRLRDFKKKPSAQQVNEWSICGFGHDAINCWLVLKAHCKKTRAAISCKDCKGAGSVWDSTASKRRAARWKSQEPPTGEGWQVWETVTEGSPISPVFATAEGLAEHLAKVGDDWDVKRGNGGWGIERAKAFVGAGWFPSMVLVGNTLHESKSVALIMQQGATNEPAA